MPSFRYKARDSAGKQVSGHAEAASEDHLAQVLHERGLFLTAARQAAADAAQRQARGKIPLSQLIAFCYQIQTITAAGVSIIDGLDALADENQPPHFRAVLQQLADDIRQGGTLSEAMERRGEAFPELVVSLVRSGEATGRLDTAMGRAGDYLRWWHETKSSLLQATIYPAILMTAVGGLVVLLITFLVPKITRIFGRSGAKMPLPTQVLITVSGFLRAHWMLVGGGLILAIVGFHLWKRTARGRFVIDGLKLRVPVIGTFVRKVFAARFTNTFCVLHNAGVHVVDALEISGKTVGNAVISAAVDQACQQVRQGRTISESLAATGEFQSLVTRMVAVGETSGALDQTMERVNDFYDREVSRSAKTMLAVLEPTMIAAAGLAVGFILLCCFLPLFHMLNVIKGH